MKQTPATVIDLLKTGHHISEEDKSAIIDTIAWQKRELEIEAALESVRTKTMAMQKSDELFEVIKTIYDELQKLGFDALVADLMIFTEDKKGYDIWLFGAYGGEGPYRTSEAFYNHPHHQGTMNAWISGESLRITELKDEQFTSFFTIVLDDVTGLRCVSEEDKNKIFSLGHIIQTEVFTKHGCIRVGSLEKRTDAQLDIQKRFAKVFDQSYTRFLDLQKAEARAREAMIEAALEKVRSRSLAMHNSNELREVVTVVFEKLKELNFGVDQGAAAILIFTEGLKDHIQWIADPEQAYATSFKTPYTEHSISSDLYMAKETGMDFFSKIYPFEEKNEFFKYLFQHSDYKGLPDNVKKLILESKSYGYSVAFAKNSAILIPTNTGKLVSENEKEILQRFVRVFEQSYTRFLDLQKAEAQAREAQIEAALERVRSRAMAMQTSEELNALIGTVFTELTKLELVLTRSVIIIYEPDGYTCRWWMANSESPSQPMNFLVDYDEQPFFDAYRKGWQEKKLKWVYELEGEDKRETDNFLFTKTELSLLPDFVIAGMRAPEKVWLSASFNNFGCLTLASLAPLPEEHFDILLRFAKVFDLTYTRFNDLKQAEAQAREAQIELGLERVRARAMAMHKSDELLDAGEILYRELGKLGIASMTSGYVIMDDEEKIGWIYAASPADGTILPKPTGLPHTNSVMASIKESWKKQEPFHIVELDEQATIDHHTYLAKNSIDFLFTVEEFLTMSPERIVMHSFNFKQGYLLVVGLARLTSAQQDMLLRFTKVFEMTYRRFLDLKHAEAQAREAKIETALEKIRSGTMAMHHSDELKNVVTVVLKILEEFNLVFEGGAVIVTFTEGSKDLTYWIASDLLSTASRFHFPYFDHPIVNMYAEAKENGKDFFAKVYPYEIKNSYYHYAFEHSDFKYLPDDLKNFIFGTNCIGVSFALTNNAAILTPSFSGEIITEKEGELLKRFARAFEQAYIRFLDLQKAEAQAREANIEAALEKVRSRSLGMHKSDELNEVILVVFEKLKEFNVVTDGVALINLYIQGTRDVIQWIANPELMTTGCFTLPYFDHPILSIIWEARESGKDFVTHTFDFEEKNSFWNYTFQNTDYKYLSDDLKKMLLASEGYGYVVAFEKYSSILVCTYTKNKFSADSIEILKRFAKVFEQAYIRFLDLQKAEAQAREARIEAALEKVRAGAMAMHKSEELGNVASLMFDQIRMLGGELWACGVVLCDKNKPDTIQWMSAPGIGMLPPNNVPHDLEPCQRHMFEAWKNGEELFMEEIGGNEIKEHYEALKTVPSLNASFKNIMEAGISLPTWQKNHVASFKHGFLLVITIKQFEEVSLFPRFAKVFEQSYTRFLDLQKAEAQAREARIEAALEKVRSRSLGMHKSDEIGDVVKSVFERLNELNVVLNTAIIIIFKENSNDAVWWLVNSENQQYSSMPMKYADTAYFRDITDARKKGKDIFSKSYTPKEKKDQFNYIFEKTNFKNVPAEQKKFILESKNFTISVGLTKNIGIQIASYTRDAFSAEENEILKRFTKVFEQSYTRFLDLQKAEAQAREAQIQLALERVRARTMAMQKSDELADVAELLFKQVKELGITPWTTGFNIWRDDNNGYEDWITNPKGGFIEPYSIDSNSFSVFRQVSEAKKRGDEFYVQYEEGDILKETYRWLSKFADKNQFGNILESGFQFPSQQYDHFVFGSKVSLMFITYQPVPEAHDIFKRFGKVFDQTYTRFLDLQKAEANAREAQIEAALERVRSSAMAMHLSKDLFSVADVLRHQLSHLGKKELESSIIHLYHDNASDFEVWYSYHPLNDATKQLVRGHIFVPVNISSWTREMMRKYHSEGMTYTIESRGEMLAEWYHVLEKIAPATVEYDSTGKIIIPEVLYYHFSKFSGGALLMISVEMPDDEACNLQLRAAKVFEMAYRRFKDLQKAEAQAREAKIEAALEKVRSKTMAMRSSDELGETASVLFQELKMLGVVKQIDRINISIVDEEKHIAAVWATKPGGEHRLNSYTLPIDELEPVKKRWDEFLKLPRQQRKETLIVTEYSGKEIIDFRTFIAKYTDLMDDSVVLDVVVEKFYQHSAGFSHGSLDINGFEKLEEEAQSIFKRFAVVFEQTYTRFMDLQRAEAQAKEAKIEAALERVRSRAMAMHNSKDVGNAIGVLFLELEHLDIATIRCGIVTINESKVMEAWGAISTEEGKIGQIIGNVDIGIHPLYQGAYEAWKQKKTSYTYELEGQDFLNYYNAVSNSKGYKIPAQYSNTERHICNFFIFKEGGLFTFTKDHFDAETSQVLEKFTAVFALTYRRYLDLKQAEEQSRQAVRQAVLDRIRAEIASMRTTTDLQRITPLIWNELTVLHVPFTRCGVFIINENERHLDVYLSTPNGEAIAAFKLPIDSEGLTPQLLAHWKNHQTFSDHWDAATFSAWTKSLIDRGAIQSKEKYNAEKAPENLYLHFLPFLQGMLYVGNTAPLAKDDLQLVQSLAEAFSAAYARYEDFSKLDNAKQQIEKTLSELKSTQEQLIQSAKMASLGELTAGVAHEIQNPLNFVNNFSEVSTELVAEMKDALRSGEKDEAITLADDLIENLQKISHHGKRADAIVKGMLQHSRVGTGKKEPTDINALADEYLRLSYHGLRAKDKGFNATIETDFDESIGKIEVVPQDIGRVLLNLYNNAFYAAPLPPEGGFKEVHKPMVWVTTKRSSSLSLGEGRGEVIISVRDNGPGIPHKIIDKIFQPFFTTKPTGQGTGLGLSLSYDIIKAHGGELRVKSTEDEGAEFIIKLPVV